MLTLYHMPPAICAQKVRVLLAEKGLPWRSEDVTGRLRDPAYLALNPGGYVPTLVHGDRVLTESRIISEYLDEAFPSPPLMPTDPYERWRVRRWTKQIDDSLHLNVWILSCAAIIRHHLAALAPEQLETALPLERIKRELTRDILAKGEDSHHVAGALKRFEKLIEDMEAALATSAWLGGDAYSLADIDLTPYLQRLNDIGLTFLWLAKPRVQDWWDRVRARPSFSAVLRDWQSDEEIAKAAEAGARRADSFAARLAAG